jgi:hypothetical protein
MPPGPAGAIQYVAAALKKFHDLHVHIEDMIAEDDKVVVRNHWTATDHASGKKLEFRGIVIWRIANKQISRALGLPGVSTSRLEFGPNDHQRAGFRQFARGCTNDSLS